jgi:hypothetical protein
LTVRKSITASVTWDSPSRRCCALLLAPEYTIDPVRHARFATSNLLEFLVHPVLVSVLLGCLFDECAFAWLSAFWRVWLAATYNAFKCTNNTETP